jgi:hypothetical protein
VSCNEIRPQLTAYLDGEVDADRGSIIRGHLRGCAACRDVARDEAAIRDGLRDLPPVDPPPSLWAGVQARLAAAEVADAERPRWRRVLGQIARVPEQALRGMKWLVVPRTAGSRIAIGAVVASAAVVLAYWRTHTVEIDGPTMSMGDAMRHVDNVLIGLERSTPTPAPAPYAPSYHDVSDDLAADDARKSARYDDAADELYQLAKTARTNWSADRQQTFDARVAKLRADIAAAKPGMARQRVQRELVHYLQGAAIRDQVAVNDKSFAGGAP